MGNVTGQGAAKSTNEMTTQEIVDRNKAREIDLLARKPEADAHIERQLALERDRELTIEENDLALGVATKPKPAPLVTTSGQQLASSSATSSLRASANTIASALDGFGFDSSKATRSRDFDGKNISTYDTKNLARNIEHSTPFRRMCDPVRWAKFLTADEITLDSVKVLEVVKLYARMFEVSTSSTSFPPDVSKWLSTSVYNQMRDLPVFMTPELFNKLCCFNFSPDGGKHLSMRSFLPRELATLDWSIPRIITALFNLQSTMTAVFGSSWSSSLNRIISECTSGEANRLYGDQVCFLVYTFENQLSRAGQVLSEVWSKSMAEFYKVQSLAETAQVVELVGTIIGEADLSANAFLSWSIRQSLLAKQKPTQRTPVPKDKQSAKDVKKPVTETQSSTKRKRPSMQDRRTVRKQADETPVPTVTRATHTPSMDNKKASVSNSSKPPQKICFCNLLHQLGVKGHGRDKCIRPNCEHLHELDRSRKADYIALVSSTAFRIPDDVRLLCEAAAQDI